MSHRPETAGVCFVTDRDATAGRPLPDIARAAVSGGCDLLQIREKDLSGGALLALTRDIVAALGPSKPGSRAGCSVVVNDRLDVALAGRAAGVHLPAVGLPTTAVRKAAGKKILIGRSTHSAAEARQAQKDGADYVIFGPVFETPGKAAYGPPAGTEALRRVLESVTVPVWAIGGITPETAVLLKGIRIAGVAAIRWIAGASDPAEAVRLLRAALVS